MRDIGLALSGGGSRAAAFHRGTVSALDSLGLLGRVDAVSSVSGGSVFAAAWMASIRRGDSTETFLADMERELRQGFVRRALMNLRIVRLLWPSYSRTELLADVFDKMCDGLRLADLPEKPALCLNVTVLNSSLGGKFSKHGFSTWGLGEATDDGGNVPVACDTFPLARAVAASAAFPVGLPPIYLRRQRWFPTTEFRSDLAGQSTLALSDGGILENLGTQTLIKSRAFSTSHIIASDAGTKQAAWRPRNPLYWARSFGIWLLSGSILERFALIMNDKQNRWMREQLFNRAVGLRPSGQNILLVRVNTNWAQVVGGVRRARLAALAPNAILPENLTPQVVEQTLQAHCPERAALLQRARIVHQSVKMSLEQLNAIGTAFSAMATEKLRALERHAHWQVLATYALYWDPWSTDGVGSQGGDSYGGRE